MSNARSLLALAAKRALWRAGLEISGPHSKHGLPRLSRAQLPPQFSSLARSPRIAAFPIDLEHVTTCTGFSFASNGYHPYTNTLNEYLRNANLKYEDSSLFRYFNTFRPQNAQQALLDIDDPPRGVLHALPPHAVLHLWTMKRDDLATWTSLDTRPENQHFGPKSTASGRREFARLIRVFESIRAYGYRSSMAREHVSGHFLYCGDRFRFLLREGQHRAAALKVLGASRVPVVVWHGIAGINCVTLHRWTTQQGGLFDVEIVNEMFHYLLRESGREKAARYGLIDPPSCARS